MALANNYVNKSKTSSLLVCRGCLATDARLYDMRQDRLLEAYSTLLSTSVQVTDDLPHYLCSYCAVLLLKCDSFRIKCIDSLIILRNAQHQHLDVATEQIKKLGKSNYLKKYIYNNINIVDKTLACKSSDVSKDTDTSSDSDMSSDSDESLDYDLREKNDCSVSENKNKLNLKSKSNFGKHKIIDNEHDYAANNSKNELQSLLKQYSDNEKSGLLKDFKINLDCEASKAISNIRDHHMQKLTEIINHIQYSSERSTELLKILDEDKPNCINNLSKSVATIKKSKVIKQESNNAEAKTINKQEVVQTGNDHEQNDIVQENTNISILVNHFNIKPIIKDFVKTDEVKLKVSDEVKLEVSQDETKDFENHFDEINESLDSEDEIAIADLKLDKQIGANYRGCKNIINGILKGRETRKWLTEEIYSMRYNTDVRHLSNEEQINEFNKRKESGSYKNGLFKCNICFKGFLAEDAYKNHMSLHDDVSGKFVCDICQCHFMTENKLFGHKKGHNRLFTCRECGHTTCHAALASQHYKWHGGKKFTCKDCGKEFKKKSTKYTHIKMSHPTSEQLVRCEICGDSFNGLVGLKFHENRSHKEMFSPECLCSGCDTQFYCSDAFKAHQGTDGLCDTLHKYCVRCGKTFETEELLKEHEIEQRKPREDFDCEVCHEKFKLFWKLKVHQRSHATTYPNYIKLYNARCSARKKEKQGNESMICEVCGKSIQNAGLLKVHYSVVHSSVKPFKCTVCSKAFKTPAMLRAHTRIHTGERPYQCQNCPKAFQTLTNLKRHNIQVHTGGARSYPCDVCGKIFHTASYVKAHIQAVHMKIPMPPRIRNRKKKS